MYNLISLIYNITLYIYIYIDLPLSVTGDFLRITSSPGRPLRHEGPGPPFRHRLFLTPSPLRLRFT